MRDLAATAKQIVDERPYGPAHKTAERFAELATAQLQVEVEPADYPRLMVAAKLARDPAMLLPDTRADIVGYLQILESMS